MGNATPKPENEKMYFMLKSKLYTLVYNIFAISQTEQIYDILEEMRSLADDSLVDDFAACEMLVNNWFNHWFPTID